LAAAASSAPAGVPAKGAVLQHLIGVICEKTGYSPNDVEPDFELEADLGIDTVKQAEIFSEVRTTFGVARDDKFSLADHSTVRKLAAWLEDRAHLAAARSFIEHDGDDASEPLSDPASDLPRSFWVRRPALVPRPCTVIASLRGRKVRLLGEGPVTEALDRALQRRGASIVHIVDPDEPQPDVDAVIDLAADALEAFVAAKALVGRTPRDWLCLTMLGEMHGMTPDQAFFDGSRAGFTKALGPGVGSPVTPGWWTSPRIVTWTPSRSCSATSSPRRTDPPEVFHGPDGVRMVVALAVESHPPALAKPKVGQVVIATGGGRGVTASVVLELARRAPGTFVLVGRTPPGAAPLNEEASQTPHPRRAHRRRREAQPRPHRGQARRSSGRRGGAPHDGGSPRHGALGWDFRSVDMGDVGAVRKLVADVLEAYGRIDGCIHGAGVEESRLLQDKDLKAFQRVFDGKALGGLTLAERLPESAWLLSMGSVAGRFGNAGQVDYAAANEALAQICKARRRSLHVCWTAWGGVGMAVRGGMQQLLESKGVELMPVQAGGGLGRRPHRRRGHRRARRGRSPGQPRAQAQPQLLGLHGARRRHGGGPLHPRRRPRHLDPRSQHRRGACSARRHRCGDDGGGGDDGPARSALRRRGAGAL
jgi:NAD(P)-dependent dehydrogenase (short-subunit alcohol dehydrogenase family)/acyl carrier protein